jgi:aspartate 1-decarboxylase
MKKCVLFSKCHRATITAADLNYEGSLSLDPVLMKACNWVEHEKVQVVNINNGNRFETYLINAEKENQGCLQLNGAAARLGQVGDLVIIMSYVWMSAEKAQFWQPKVVLVNELNQPYNIPELALS